MTATLLAPDTFPTDLTSSAWGAPEWPAKFTSFRPHQIEAICKVVNLFDQGVDVVLLDAPTGAGKTAIAEGVRRLLDVERTLYCPDTKQLQAQFMEDFGAYAKLLKGRANYPTLDNPGAFRDRFAPITAADCMKQKEMLPACGSCNNATDIPVPHCRLCHPTSKCPYFVAKQEAFDSPLAVLNTSYLIAEANSGGQFSGSDLIVIDECDTLEHALMGQVEVFLSQRRAKELDLNPPELKTVAESWLTWVNEEAIPKIGEQLHAAKQELRWRTDVDTLRKHKYLGELLAKLHMLRSSLEEGNAVYDGYEKGDIRFLPVHVAPFGPTSIWAHAERFLLMSATIIDPTEMVDSLGIERAGKRWDIVKVDSTFPAERRPIHVKHACEMSYKNKDTAWPEMAKMVRRVLEEKHPSGRVLIHTVSYTFTKFLYNELRTIGRPVLIYEDAKQRDEILATYKRLDGAVLLAPSMERGVDLPMDLCDAVIVTKMPFASTADKRVRARMYSKGGQSWYQVQTIRKLVQMTGRGMRSEDDYCDIWILDAAFTNNLWKKAKNLLPKWWKDSLDWSGGGL